MLLLQLLFLLFLRVNSGQNNMYLESGVTLVLQHVARYSYNINNMQRFSQKDFKDPSMSLLTHTVPMLKNIVNRPLLAITAVLLAVTNNNFVIFCCNCLCHDQHSIISKQQEEEQKQQ